jgi:hypothetical protein
MACYTRKACDAQNAHVYENWDGEVDVFDCIDLWPARVRRRNRVGLGSDISETGQLHEQYHFKQGMMIGINGSNIDTSGKLVNGQECKYKGFSRGSSGAAAIIWVEMLDPDSGKKQRAKDRHLNQRFSKPPNLTAIKPVSKGQKEEEKAEI